MIVNEISRSKNINLINDTNTNKKYLIYKILNVYFGE